MPYPENFVYLRALGTFGTSANDRKDIWGVGFKFRNPGTSPSVTNLVTFMESASVHISNFHVHAQTMAGSACWLRELTCALIGPDGKYLGGATQQTQRRLYGTPVAGAGTSSNAFSTAIVTSLRTQVNRGPGSNGRIYWPALAVTANSDTGGLTALAQGNYATQAQTLINALNNSAQANLPGTGGVSVMSAVSTGIAASVTSIRVGLRIDRQERRENEISEGYVSKPITPLAGFAVRRDNEPIGQPRD